MIVRLVLAFFLMGSGMASAQPAEGDILNQKLEFMARIYRQIPLLHLSNQSALENVIFCLQSPNSSTEIFKYEESQKDWIRKVVSCRRILEFLVKGPLDEDFINMRLELALSAPSRRPGHWQDVKSSPHFWMNLEPEHFAKWRLMSAGMRAATLKPLSQEEIRRTTEKFYSHLKQVCEENSSKFAKHPLARRLQVKVRLDCEADSTRVEILGHEKSNSQLISIFQKDWNQVLLSSLNGFHQRYRQAYIQRLQSLPYLLMLEDYVLYKDMTTFLQDQKQVAQLLRVFESLLQLQKESARKFKLEDETKGLSQKLAKLENLGPAEKASLYQELLAIHDNLSGGLFLDQKNDSNMPTVARVMKDRDDMRLHSERVELYAVLGVIGVCLIPQGKLLKGVGHLARWLGVTAGVRLPAWFSCLATTVVVNSFFVAKAYSDLTALVEDGASFSMTDRTRDTSQMMEKVDKINPILLFF